MALHLTVSDNLHTLVKKLHLSFEERPLSVFQPRLLVTQTVGMNNWLKIQIASFNHSKIAANLLFLSPADVLHKVYAALGGSFPDKLASTHVSWIIYTILGEKKFQEKFPSIAQYYTQGLDLEKKQMGLAEKIADLLDQYQVYRPKMIAQWNSDSLDNLHHGNDWQAYIWLRCRVLAGDRFLDRTQQGRDIQLFMQDPDRISALQSRIPALHLFGLSILTQYHVDILHELSNHIDIHFYLLNPAPETYWYGDIGEKVAIKLLQKGRTNEGQFILGNPLLMQWGKVVKDSFALLFEHDAFLNALDTLIEEKPFKQHLLAHIQEEIRQNIPQSERSTINTNMLRDGSITVQSNFTAAREVEALYNYLVRLIDQKKESLSARDIVVMVSNIDAYAPFIQSVFDYAPYSFPYTIADESITSSDNVMQALAELLTIDESTFTAERVMQLLEHTCIRNKFQLLHFEKLRNWVDRLNIRFGFYGNTRLDTQYVSWKQGIRRLMLGICMGDELPLEDGTTIIDPFIEVEGADSWEAIRFCQSIEVLIALIEQRKQNRTIEGWILYTRQVIQHMISLDGDAGDELFQSLEDQLDQYAPVFDTLPQEFSYEVFTQHFVQSLQGHTTSRAFAGSGITFCSPVPMRSIPFKVVAFLGLNFDQFPRNENPISFDLLQKDPKRGDRNIKQNDKHLFLETLLSAQDYLYLSYIGRDSKDNTVLPPSALVDELLDYIESALETELSLRTDWVVQQPLHAHSRQYNASNPMLYSYTLPQPVQKNMEWRTQEPANRLSEEQLSLTSLESYFSKPAVYYVEQVLGVTMRKESNLLAETERFELDALEQWKWKNKLMGASVEDKAAWMKKGIRTGALPLRNLGRLTGQHLQQEIQWVEHEIQTLTQTDIRTIPLSIQIDGLTLEGQLTSVYGDQYVHVCFSKNETHHQIQAYIRYVVGRATEQIQSSLFYSVKTGKAWRYATMTPATAKEKLHAWIQYWRAHATETPCLYPVHTNWKAALEDEDQYQESIDKIFDANAFTEPDSYAALIYEKGAYANWSAYDDFVHRYQLVLQESRESLEPLT